MKWNVCHITNLLLNSRPGNVGKASLKTLSILPFLAKPCEPRGCSNNTSKDGSLIHWVTLFLHRPLRCSITQTVKYLKWLILPVLLSQRTKYTKQCPPCVTTTLASQITKKIISGYKVTVMPRQSYLLLKSWLYNLLNEKCSLLKIKLPALQIYGPHGHKLWWKKILLNLAPN